MDALYFFKQTGVYICLYKEILAIFFAIHNKNNKAKSRILSLGLLLSKY